MFSPKQEDFTFSIHNYEDIVFDDIKDFYPQNVDLVCSFKRVTFLVNYEKYFIGIYKIGWKRFNDFITRVPITYDKRNSVLFKGRY
jgi:hypothetical protein